MKREDAESKSGLTEEIKILARFPEENPNPVMRITTEGIIAYANPGSAPLLEAWNCKPGERLPDERRKFVLLDVFNSGNNEEMEVLCGERVFLISFLPVKDAGYIYAYGRDITERKRAEEALRESEEMYRTIFETSGSAAIIIEGDATITLPQRHKSTAEQGRSL